MSKEKKQSSIEWLIDELYKIEVKYLDSTYDEQMSCLEYVSLKHKAIDKAKEMHREETKTAWNHGFDWGQMEQSLAEQGKPSTLIDSEHYYNETFKK